LADFFGEAGCVVEIQVLIVYSAHGGQLPIIGNTDVQKYRRRRKSPNQED